MIADVALPLGDVLEFDSNTPGGYTLQGHSTNTTSLTKIVAGNWDYVILQEQSQRPAFPIAQVEAQVFPYATQLDALIHEASPCAETMFYMTWGRKNGDASNCDNFPPLCTYEGMDDLLRERYVIMAEDNNALVSPVGAVWRYIREMHPEIELYNADESHPSLAGSYAAACTFYATIFERDPSLITTNFSLSAADAENIRAAAKAIVFDNLSDWFIGAYDPSANFNFSADLADLNFENTSTNATSYSWDFGDGTSSDEENPNHTYAEPGIYTITLEATDCGESSTITQEIEVSLVGVAENDSSQLEVYPNPVIDNLNIRMKSIDAIRLIDAAGKSVAIQISASQEFHQIDCSKFSRGIYVLLIEAEGKTYSRKLVLE